MTNNLFKKDPDDVLDFTVDWTDWLNGDTISSSSWTVETGLTEDSEANTDLKATVWVSGGTAGVLYSATNRIVTTNGRTKDQTIYILVEEQ